MRDNTKNGQFRKDIKIGSQVSIVLKQNQRSGILTHGKVKNILTNSVQHPHGIKVRLISGEVGRVKKVIDHDNIDEGEEKAL